MEILQEYMVLVLPLLLIQLTLAITALVHVLRHPVYRFGNKLIWSLVVVIFGYIGPIVYFVFGRGDEG